MVPVERGVSDLPEDVLGIAMAFLDFRALGRAEGVCRLWRDTAATDDAWRAMHFALGGTHTLAPGTGTLKLSCHERVKAVLSLPALSTEDICLDDIYGDTMPSYRDEDQDDAVRERICGTLQLILPYARLVADQQSGVYRREPDGIFNLPVLHLPHFSPRPLGSEFALMYLLNLCCLFL